MAQGKFTKEELQAKADRVFDNFKKADRVFATTDGNVFLSQNRAELHAGKGKVIPFLRPVVASNEKQDSPAMNAKDAIEAIKAADLEGLAGFAGDDRKSVQKAYEKRLEELDINPKKDS